jgi:ketoreductase RED1
VRGRAKVCTVAVCTVVGAGVIGVSWARLFAEAGWDVRVSDPRPDLADIISTELAGLPVVAEPDLAAAAEGTDHVQEAGPERIDIKHQVFGTLAAHTRDDVVLASSSSSLLPSVIAEGNAAADRIVIGHPFNPPELIPLIEVVPGAATSPEIVARAVEIYRGLGKLPITLKKEIPGFVGNRLQKVLNDQAMDLASRASSSRRTSTSWSRHRSGSAGPRSARSRAGTSAAARTASGT